MFSNLKKILKISFYTLLLIAGITFCVSNRAKVEFTLFPLPYAVSLPLFIFAITVFVLGILLGWAIAKIKIIRIVKANKATTARVLALENELSALRSEKRIK